MDTVLYWNSVLLEVSRRDFTSGMPNGQQAGPIGTSRAMAIVHLAIHDTVAYSTSGGANAAYLAKKGTAPPVIPSPASAVQMDDRVGGAAVAALKAMYPAYAKFINDSVPSPPPVAADVAFGAEVAAKILQLRTNDGSENDIFGGQIPNPGYGVHRSDPYQPGQENLGPTWGNVKRFTGTAHQPLDPFPGHGQPSFLSDPDYKDDFEEVRDFGALARNKRTAEQERIGVYWGYDGGRGIGVPPRLYLQIAREVIKNRVLSTQQLAELFAMLTVAMADAGIDSWHYKYLFDLWRPVVGVRNELPPGARDVFWAPYGIPQPNTVGRRTWTPPFPAYPSGHATFGAALFQVLRRALRTTSSPIKLDDVLKVESGKLNPIAREAFSFVSDELDGFAGDPDGSSRTRVSQSFKTFAQAIWENSISRVYLGVHWRFDGVPRVAGQNIGGVPLGLAVGVEAYNLFNTAPSLSGTQP